MTDKGKLLYKEDTYNHIDDIWLSREGQNRKEGNNYTILFGIIISSLIVILCFSIGVLGYTRTGVFSERFIFILAGIFLLLFVMSFFKLIFITDHLKIYSEGITLPTRSINEWWNKKEHFIAFTEIKKIRIERRYFERKKGKLMPIEFYKKDGSIEKINPYFIGNLKKVEELLMTKVKIIKKEYTSEELMRIRFNRLFKKRLSKD